MQKTVIEWTDQSWNPQRGCTKYSPGCANCYADTIAHRFQGVKGNAYRLGFKPRLVPSKLHEPVTLTHSCKIFVNSMSDFFHGKVPLTYLQHECEIMIFADWHIYQVLTKRHDQMERLLSGPLKFAAESGHIWWGVSVENRKNGIPRIDALRKTPAAVKFLSCEPLLEDLGEIDLTGINWVIVGGESGYGYRPIEASWVQNILTQCQDQNVPFFFKQWGGTYPKSAGRILNGRTFDEFPIYSFKSIKTQRDRRIFKRKIDSWYPDEIINKQEIVL